MNEIKEGGCSDLWYDNKLAASEKKQEEYMKFIITKQHHNKRSTNGFMIKDLYQGLSFHLECVMIKINKSVAIHAKGEKR